MKLAGIVVALVVLAGCSSHAKEPAVIERIVEAPALLDVHAQGELQSSKTTPLNVPGQGWSRRQLDWTQPDGSWVDKHQLVSRDSADDSMLQ